MSRTGAPPPFVLAIMVAVSIASVALATPAADSFRQAIAPRLPLYVIVLAIISAIAQLVSVLVDVLSRSFERRVVALRITVAASALLMALAFSSTGTGRRPLLLPLAASALLAIVSAAIARRSRLQANL